MLILAINTATINTGIAVLEVKESGGRVIWEKEWKSNYNEAEKLLPSIKTALTKARKDLKKNDPQKIPGMVFVVNGPGSFTGLRIGITVANSIAWAAGAAVAARTTFEYLEASLPPAYGAKCALILRAGGDMVAISGPLKSSHTIIPVSSLPEYFKKNKSVKYVLADLKPDEKKKIKLPPGIKWLTQKSVKPFGKTVLDLLGSIKKLNSKKRSATAAQEIIQPFYLQPPKITQSKKQVFATKD